MKRKMDLIEKVINKYKSEKVARGKYEDFELEVKLEERSFSPRWSVRVTAIKVPEHRITFESSHFFRYKSAERYYQELIEKYQN